PGPTTPRALSTIEQPTSGPASAVTLPRFIAMRVRRSRVGNYSEQLVVIASASAALLAACQSRPHEYWTRAFGSSMKDDLRYTPSDCFETFPFPFDSPSRDPASSARSGQAPDLEPAIEAALEAAGREYYDFRAALMVRNNEGLTKTYNRFHDRDHDGTGVAGRDPAEVVRDIERLRHLHDVMDRAVLDAYGWTDIRPTCQFILDYEDDDDDTAGERTRRRKPWRYRWPDAIRDDVLARLLDLNAKRAKEEALAIASEPSTTSSVRRKRRSKSQKTPLLDGSD
ncbi:MAG: type IIL restriction-modification enzyme MmeI, partial [Acidobacteriota bacterium]